METIIIADDHPMTLSGISKFVTSMGYKVLGEYTNGITAYNNMLTLKPDYCILDISMPGMTGLEVLEKIRSRNKTLKIILYTMYHDLALFEKAKSLDVNGYILKDFALEELKDCLEFLRYKKQWFTPRLSEALIHTSNDTEEEKFKSLSAAEKKIVSLIAKQTSSKEIAEQLFISEKTVEHHRSNVIKKLCIEGSKNGLLLWAVNHKHLM